MHKLNRQAERVFRRLIDGVGEAAKIDNAPGAFMAVHVDRLLPVEAGEVWALAHYYEQNGDMCCDPDMSFLVNDLGVFPLTYQQAIPPIFNHVCNWTPDGRAIRSYKPGLSRELAQFANTWLENIRQQQYGGRLPRLSGEQVDRLAVHDKTVAGLTAAVNGRG